MKSSDRLQIKRAKFENNLTCSIMRLIQQVLEYTHVRV
jgi:hypothetical protein